MWKRLKRWWTAVPEDMQRPRPFDASLDDADEKLAREGENDA